MVASACLRAAVSPEVRVGWPVLTWKGTKDRAATGIGHTEERNNVAVTPAKRLRRESTVLL
jgi:hypothetical protein